MAVPRRTDASTPVRCLDAPLPMDVTDSSTGCGSRSVRQRSGGCLLGSPPTPALAMQDCA